MIGEKKPRRRRKAELAAQVVADAVASESVSDLPGSTAPHFPPAAPIGAGPDLPAVENAQKPTPQSTPAMTALVGFAAECGIDMSSGEPPDDDDLGAPTDIVPLGDEIVTTRPPKARPNVWSVCLDPVSTERFILLQRVVSQRLRRPAGISRTFRVLVNDAFVAFGLEDLQPTERGPKPKRR